VKLLWNVRYTDLGPFRVIRRSALERLQMSDTSFGWTIEMQVKAAQRGLRVAEVPVTYRPRRGGRSKVSGNLIGSARAGIRILQYIMAAKASEWLPRLRKGQEAPAGLREWLIIFTRFPQLGSAKTRLIRALGARAAMELHREMTLDTVNMARGFAAERGSAPLVFFTGGSSADMARWLGSDLTYRPQEGENLGERLAIAFGQGFAQGIERIVAIGTDCPALDRVGLAQAFAELSTHDLVLGPATDGGYYLIGIREDCPDLFRNIDWGTDRVCRQTLAAAQNLGLSVHTLKTLPDVDRPEDLEHLPSRMRQRIMAAGRVGDSDRPRQRIGSEGTG
jgi:rSAM/selenodomain-associated transferase 1